MLTRSLHKLLHDPSEECGTIEIISTYDPNGEDWYIAYLRLSKQVKARVEARTIYEILLELELACEKIIRERLVKQDG